ncbi:LAFA_0F09076g1_1 [Lachancea sp. 'fantastica']|nr:LAFA_0F09076g1_1 [Lachancea sp. 'fantastica']
MDSPDLKPQLQRSKTHEKPLPAGNRDMGNQDMVCNCEDELDIFERFVQDPCMDSWEDLDEDKDGDGDGEGKGELHEHLQDEEYGSPKWEDEEVLDPVTEGVESMQYKGTRLGLGSGTGNQNPNVCSKCHKLRRWKTGGSTTQDSADEPILRCSRTNSFMSQLSRQASRQSLPDSTENAVPSVGSPAENGVNMSGSWTRSRSRSSFGGSCAIPAHLYCLERFVSCELDSAAECFFRKNPPPPLTCTTSASADPPGSPTLSRVLSGSSSTSKPVQNDLIQHSTQTQLSTVPLTKRRSRVSSIELSLMNSMSS